MSLKFFIFKNFLMAMYLTKKIEIPYISLETSQIAFCVKLINKIVSKKKTRKSMVMLKHRVFAISLHKQPPLARRQGLLLSASWFTGNQSNQRACIVLLRILCKLQYFHADYCRTNLRKAFVSLCCASCSFQALQEIISQLRAFLP